MFERMKGVAKGGKVANATSESTMNTINWLIKQGKELQTNDTLFTCRTYYFYAKLISFPTNMSQNKFIKYTGAMDVQAKTLLKDWLKNTTGVFSLGDYLEDFDDEFQKFSKQINDKYGTPEGDMNQRFNVLKSYALEEVISIMQEYFDLHIIEFKNLVASCCEEIRSDV